MWNSTRSNGWEYLVALKGLGFKSYIYQLCVILIVYYFGNMLDHDEWYYNPRFIEIMMKHEMVKWLCIDVAIEWLYVRTLVDTN